MRNILLQAAILMFLKVCTLSHAGEILIPNPDGIIIDPIDTSGPLVGGPRHPYPPNDPRSPFGNFNENPKGQFVFDPPKTNGCGCRPISSFRKIHKSEFVLYRSKNFAKGVGKGVFRYAGPIFGIIMWPKYYSEPDDDESALLRTVYATASSAIDCTIIGAMYHSVTPYRHKTKIYGEDPFTGENYLIYSGYPTRYPEFLDPEASFAIKEFDEYMEQKYRFPAPIYWPAHLLESR